MEKYDAIIIGAGNGGLMSTLELAKYGKKVLLLEKSNKPGGLATSFIRGRFEFEASLFGLNNYGNEEHPGELYHLFKKLGLQEKVDFVTVKEAYHVYAMDENVDYTMPFGIMEYMEKMEEYVPGSQNALKKFFVLAEESKEALIYIEQNKNKLDASYLKRNFPDFLKVSTHTVDKVLEAIKMPKRAQEILTSCWVYFGSPTDKLSFVHFAASFFSMIAYGLKIPYKKSGELSLLLEEEIRKNGGEIKYNSMVKEILFKDRKIAGVHLTNGEIYETNHLICNISPTVVFGSLLPESMVPINSKKLANSRILGGKGFSIFLGLNQSPKDLGLENYSYIICESLDSHKEYLNKSSLKTCSSMAYVLNNAIPSCSAKGTTILEFNSPLMQDTFIKNVTEKNYFELKSRIAESIIDAFEKTTKISIKPYIEEIEIATPITYARYTGHPDGSIYGYKATGMDNLLPRMLSEEKETLLENLRFCGSFSSTLSGFGATYMSGHLAAKGTLKDIEKEEETWN